MCFKNLLSKALPAFVGAALIVAGCDKAQTPPSENEEPVPETVKHFTVTLADKTTTACVVSIDKDDDDQLFYYAIARKKDFEKLGETFQERAKAYYEGDLAFMIDEMGFTKDEALSYIVSAVDLVEFPVDYLLGNTSYVLIVGYITPEGVPAGDFECVEFDTPAPEPSDNKLTVEVSGIEARSAHVSVTATNSDQFNFRYFPASQFGDLSGSELAAEILYYYKTWEPDYRYESFEEDLEGLKAGTKYIAAAVGCTDFAPTTDIATFEFTTLPAGDAGKWNFDVNFTDGDIKGYKLNVEITPNDDTIDYCYELIPAEYTQKEFFTQFKEHLVFMEEVGVDKETYIEWYGAYGPVFEENQSVKPGQSYKIAAVPVDPVSREFIGAIFSKSIEIPTPGDSDITISVDWDKYFDGAELPDLWLGDGAIFDPVITTEAERYFFGVYVDDGTTYSKGDIIVALMDNGRNQESWSKTLTVPFGRDAVLYAVALDDEGLFGPVFSKKFNLSRDGVSPADEYETPGESLLAKKADFRKSGAGKTDAKRAAAEKIRRNWTGASLSAFDAE